MRRYSLLIEDRTIEIYSYNIETVLAEKLETIISRSVANTRMRDFYDVYILLDVQKENMDLMIFKKAVEATAKRRSTTHLFKRGSFIIQDVLNDETMKVHWERYQKKYNYAKDISWDLIGVSLIELWRMQK